MRRMRARARARQGMTEAELADCEKNDKETYMRLLANAYDQLSNAGAHYVIDDITGVFERLTV